ncbi:hypothetical protein LguiB_012432 [Lonicera macranthoides]
MKGQLGGEIKREGDVIRPSSSFYPIMVVRGIPNDEVRIQRHEPREEGIDGNKFFTKPRDNVRAELKIDFIGVDRFDVHPNFLLIEFFNELRRIALQHDLNFEEFCFARRIKRQRYSKYLFSWQGRFELFQFDLRMKREKYSKYLFYWHGRFQVPKLRLNVEVVKDWLNQGMGRPDSRTNLLEEEGYDVIRPSSSFYPIMVQRDLKHVIQALDMNHETMS